MKGQGSGEGDVAACRVRALPSWAAAWLPTCRLLVGPLNSRKLHVRAH